MGYWFRAFTGASGVGRTLRTHFGGVPLAQVATAAREFPVTSRVDLQAALDEMLAAWPGATLLGVHSQMNHETPTFAHLFAPGPFQMEFGPLQHDEVDVGEPVPIRCLRNGLWLVRKMTCPLPSSSRHRFNTGAAAAYISRSPYPSASAAPCFPSTCSATSKCVSRPGRRIAAGCSRSRATRSIPGRGGAIKVHRLHRVSREDVILPQKTLALLDRNVGGFVAARQQIRALRFSTKKGLLFYGPPGTGKTHTIHYLASQLPEHTTLLITAEQVGLLGEYFRLARFLQPAIMVVEDVDLIARDRVQMHNPMQEVLLNQLLNEMDGLREDAEILFILTTNRPDQLEPALASRPGRIDQAIEFPLPDDEGRAKIARLYSRGLEVPTDVLNLIVRRTQGASPAFIKELMRRSAQFQIEHGGGNLLQPAAVDGAIEEMVFVGGALNLKLLGGSTDLQMPGSGSLTIS